MSIKPVKEVCNMEEEDIITKLNQSIINFDVDGVREAAKEAIKIGVPYKAVTEGMIKGMEIVGKKYEENEYFLTELILAGEAMQAGLEILGPWLKAEKVKSAGRVVIGTVKGDIHLLGKNIVVTFLKSAGFDIYDLGVDVPAEEFVRKAKETNADIIGMSALISTSFTEMEKVIKKLIEADLREQVKVIVGGATVTEKLARQIGADAYAPDAITGVEICIEWMKEKKSRK